VLAAEGCSPCMWWLWTETRSMSSPLKQVGAPAANLTLHCQQLSQHRVLRYHCIAAVSACVVADICWPVNDRAVCLLLCHHCSPHLLCALPLLLQVYCRHL